MKSDFATALKYVASERNLPPEVVLEAVEAALISAYKRDYGAGQNISVKIDTAGKAQVFAEREVVEEVEDERLQISLEEATALDPEIEIGQIARIEVTPKEFGRIAAQTAKQVILQRIREAERDTIYQEYAEREGDIINGQVQNIQTNAVILNLGRAEAILPRAEQISGERYHLRQRVRAYVYEVAKTNKGPQIYVSRTHRDLLRRLLELEVPEIYNGTVEIKAIAREAGSRSKVAVAARQAGIDPVGSCVGMRGFRIQNIVHELNGEKIDVIEWDPDLRVFIANALSPAKVISVELAETEEEGKTATVVVPDNQLSLAIGKEGQNARLAAKLTNWRIDIINATEAAELALRKAEEEAEAAEAEEALIEEEAAVEAAEAVLAEAEAILEEAVKEAAEVEAPVAEGEEEAAEPATVAEEPHEEEPTAAAPEPVEEKMVEAIFEVEEWTIPEELAEEEEEIEFYGKKDKKKKKAKKRRGRLVYDEDLGEVVIRRERKPGRRQDDWQRELEKWEQERGYVSDDYDEDDEELEELDE
ncbi:MAG: transcription termination factor NusA [Anaerolineae bacterium]